jgi:hypothetical protein
MRRALALTNSAILSQDFGILGLGWKFPLVLAFYFCVVLYRFYGLTGPQYLTVADEVQCLDFVDLIDDPDTNIVSTRVRPMSRTIEIVHECKNEFGMLKRTESNRLMVHKFVRDQLRAIPDMRASHVAQQLPLLVELVFIPTETEIMAKKMRQSAAVQMRVSEYDDEWRSRSVENPKYLGFSAS